MKVTKALAGLVLLASAAHAQATAEQLSRCAALRTSATRLACYDALAKPKPAPRDTVRARPTGAGRIGKWIASRETDPISDQKNVTFMLEAEGGGLFDTRSLIIRCRNGELDLYVAPHEYLGQDNTTITIRLGTEAPFEEDWTGSGDHTALFHPGDRGEIEAFVRRLTRYDRVAFQVTPYSKAPLSMVFRLAGIAQLAQELWTTCPPQQGKPETKAPEGVRLELPSDQVFFEADVEEEPEVLSGPALQYPDPLRQAGVQGRVIVQCILDTLGRAEPASVKVVQSPNEGFNQEAMAYVRRAMFRPARVHGRAVRVLLNLPIDFTIRP